MTEENENGILKTSLAMNRKFIFLLLGICLSVTSFPQEEKKEEEKKQTVTVNLGSSISSSSPDPLPDWIGKVTSAIKGETTLDDGMRFGRLGDYMLDKFTGDVYFFDTGVGKRPERILIEREQSEDEEIILPGTVNYMLFIWQNRPCLMNIRSGDVWYMKNSGNRKAKLLYVPVERGKKD